MAKVNEKATPKVTASKKSINRIIEDFTGIHNGDDVVALPLEGNPVITESDNDVVNKVKVATPPPTKIPNCNKDDVQKGIDKIIKGNSSSQS